MPTEDDLVLLAGATNQVECDMICGALQENDIPFIRKYAGVDSYLHLYMRRNNEPIQIHVAENDIEAAKAILETILPDQTDDETEERPGFGGNRRMNAEEEAYNKKRRASVWVLRFFVFGVILIPAVIYLIVLLLANL